MDNAGTCFILLATKRQPGLCNIGGVCAPSRLLANTILPSCKQQQQGTGLVVADGEGVFRPRELTPEEREALGQIPQEEDEPGALPGPPPVAPTIAETVRASAASLNTTDGHNALGALPIQLAGVAPTGTLEDLRMQRPPFAVLAPDEALVLAGTADPTPAHSTIQPPPQTVPAMALLDGDGSAAVLGLPTALHDIRRLTTVEHLAGMLSAMSDYLPHGVRQVLKQISNNYVEGAYPATQWAATNYLRIHVQAHEAAALRRRQSPDSFHLNYTALAQAYAEEVLWLGQNINWQGVLRDGFDIFAIAHEYWFTRPLAGARERLRSIGGPLHPTHPSGAGDPPADEARGL